MSDEKICQLSVDDAKLLLTAFEQAQNTPMIKFSSDQKDLATSAWDRVRDIQIELAKKYGYNWEAVKISGKGEVFKI